MPTPRRRMLRLRVTIQGIEPEIWRTVDVDESLSLADLHRVLQEVFAWRSSHLHRFSDGDPWARENGIPRIGRRPRAWTDAWSLAESDIEGEEDEADTTIGDAMRDGGPLWYVYDLGDDWVHRIELIDRDNARPGEPRASLVIGERRAPFEDCGGITGYSETLEILAQPAHPDHASTARWVRSAVGPWGSADPDDADLDGANAELGILFGDGVDDLSGLVSDAPKLAADAPVATFAAWLRPGFRSELRRHLRRTDLLTSEPLPDEVAEIIRPYAWLIDRIGADGLTLTKAGWMPPAAVLEGMTELGWRDEWIGEANREDLTIPMRHLREAAERLRLIRKVKGRLEVVARVRPAIGNPALLGEHVGRMLLRQRMTDVERAACVSVAIALADGSVSTRDDAEEHAAWILSDLGYVQADGGMVDRRSGAAVIAPLTTALQPVGLWRWDYRRRDVAVSDAHRVLARLALR